MNIVISEYELEQIKYIKAMFFLLKRAVYFTGNSSKMMENEIKSILKHQLSFLSDDTRKVAINFLIKIEEDIKRGNWDWKNVFGSLHFEYISIFEKAITTIFLAYSLSSADSDVELKFRNEIWNPKKNKYYGKTK